MKALTHSFAQRRHLPSGDPNAHLPCFFHKKCIIYILFNKQFLFESLFYKILSLEHFHCHLAFIQALIIKLIEYFFYFMAGGFF